MHPIRAGVEADLKVRLYDDERFLLAGNQGTGNIVTFTVDGDTGKLTATGAKAEVPRPVCIQFALV